MRESTSPYPGLRTFGEREAHLFFGRDGHTDRLMEILANRRFLAVIGPSGCGKSSLVRAGLLPSLSLGAIGTGHSWRRAIFRPGGRPLSNLASALLEPAALGPELNYVNSRSEIDQRIRQCAHVEAELRRGPRALLDLVADARQSSIEPDFNLLILVDQFEELFTHSVAGEQGDDEAEALVNLLLRSREDAAARVFVVITMRTDFLGDCVRFLDLPDVINRGQFLTPRLNRTQLAAAITGPARQFGGDVDAALVTEMANALETDQDELPVLQHALARMWRHANTKRGKTPSLGLNDLADVGRISGALPKHAEELFDSLSKEGRGACEWVFRGITEQRTAESGGQRVRRPQKLRALADWAMRLDWQDFTEVLRTFGSEEAGFLVFNGQPDEPKEGGATVLDIAHEALIRRWERLQRWTDAEARAGRRYLMLCERCKPEHDGQSLMLQGRDLAHAIEWNESGLNSDFLSAQAEHQGAPHAPHAAWAARYIVPGGQQAGFEQVLLLLKRSRTARIRDRLVRRVGFGLLLVMAVAVLWYVRNLTGDQKASELVSLAEVSRESPQDRRERVLLDIASAAPGVRGRVIDRWLNQDDSAASVVQHEALLRAAVGLDPKLAARTVVALDSALKRSASNWKVVRILAASVLPVEVSPKDLLDAMLSEDPESDSANALGKRLSAHIASASNKQIPAIAQATRIALGTEPERELNNAGEAILQAWIDGLKARIADEPIAEINDLYKELANDLKAGPFAVRLRNVLLSTLLRHGTLQGDQLSDALSRFDPAPDTTKSEFESLLNALPEVESNSTVTQHKVAFAIAKRSTSELSRLSGLMNIGRHERDEIRRMSQAIFTTVPYLSTENARNALGLISKPKPEPYESGRYGNIFEEYLPEDQQEAINLLDLRANHSKDVWQKWFRELGTETTGREKHTIDSKTIRRLRVFFPHLDPMQIERVGAIARAAVLSADGRDELRAIRHELSYLLHAADSKARAAVIKTYLGEPVGPSRSYTVARLVKGIDVALLVPKEPEFAGRLKSWLSEALQNPPGEAYEAVALAEALIELPDLAELPLVNLTKKIQLAQPDVDGKTAKRNHLQMVKLSLLAARLTAHQLEPVAARSNFESLLRTMLAEPVDNAEAKELTAALGDFVFRLSKPSATAVADAVLANSHKASLQELRLTLTVVQPALMHIVMDSNRAKQWLAMARLPFADPALIATAVTMPPPSSTEGKLLSLPELATQIGDTTTSEVELAAGSDPQTTAKLNNARSETPLPSPQSPDDPLLSNLVKAQQDERNTFELLLDDPFDISALISWMVSLSSVGHEQKNADRLEESLLSARRQLTVNHWRVSAMATDRKALRDYTISLSNLTKKMLAAQQTEAAAPLMEQLRKSATQFVHSWPDDYEARSEYIDSLIAAAFLFQIQGAREQAGQLREQALKAALVPIPKEVDADEHWRWRLLELKTGNQIFNQMVVYSGLYAAELPLAQKLATVADNLDKTDSKEVLHELCLAHYGHGQALESSGHWGPARQAYAKANDIAQRIDGYSVEYATPVLIASRKARLKAYSGQYKGALSELEETLLQSKERLKADPSEDTRETIAVQYQRMGEVHLLAGEPVRAADALLAAERELLGIRKAEGGRMRLLEVLVMLMEARLAEGDRVQVSALAKRARDLLTGLANARRFEPRFRFEELRMARLEAQLQIANGDRAAAARALEQLPGLLKKVEEVLPGEEFVRREAVRIKRLTRDTSSG